MASRTAFVRFRQSLLSRVSSTPLIATLNPTLQRNELHNVITIGSRVVRSMTSMSAGNTLKQLATENPHIEVIRYHHKNVKWTLKHVDFFAEALAIGLLDNGLRKGDVVLSWLPRHFSEQHILQFACSKAGFVLYHLDPSLTLQNPESSKKALSKALEITNANVLVTQEAGNDMNYVHIVEAVVPEIRIFNFGEGMPFFSPRYPHLRFPIHVGFDYEEKGGMVPIKDMLCPTGDLQGALGGATIDGSTPLFGEFIVGKDGVPTSLGKTLSNEDVIKSSVWPELTSILKKEYREVEGVGVVF